MGTVAEIDVADVKVIVAAAIPLNLMAVAPVRFVPVIVTLVPTEPVAGVKLVIVGGGVTVKLAVLVTVPPGVVTLILPVVAPTGAVAVICVAETTVKDVAAMPLNATAVAPVKFVPVRVTRVPATPVAGDNAVKVGAGSVTV